MAKQDDLFFELMMVRLDAMLFDEKLKKQVNDLKDIFWLGDCADSKCKYMHQTFIQSGCFFMVTHHARGISLKSYLDVKKYLPENQIKFIAYQLVKGIGQLHDNNIIFRNLTTESILITD